VFIRRSFDRRKWNEEPRSMFSAKYLGEDGENTLIATIRKETSAVRSGQGSQLLRLKPLMGTTTEGMQLGNDDLGAQLKKRCDQQVGRYTALLKRVLQ
jgi:hypothetical protein